MVDQLRLGLARDTILQIFTYMDTDEDNQLRYKDFCSLCAEQVLSAPPSDASVLSSNKTAGSDFSRIIKSMKSQGAGSRGRGGPSFKRGASAHNPDNFVTKKNMK